MTELEVCCEMLARVIVNAQSDERDQKEAAEKAAEAFKAGLAAYWSKPADVEAIGDKPTQSFGEWKAAQDALPELMRSSAPEGMLRTAPAS